MGKNINKLKFSQISKLYDVILINNWIELKEALANQLIIMALIKKDTNIKPGGDKPTISEVFKTINDLRVDFNKFVEIENKRWAKQEKFNKQQEKFNKTIINRLDNIVKLNNLKE